MNQPKKERFKTSVGGQALMEGIMMRGPKQMCCAVRKPDGTIETRIDPVKNHGIWTKIPLVRGAISMIESLIVGYRYMMYSAQVSMGDDYDPEEEETAFEKWVGEHFGQKAEDALLACAAVDLLTRPELLTAARAEFETATARGYVIPDAGETGLPRQVACRHDGTGTRDELNAMVDCGCTVVDVIVDHPVYGQLSAPLHLRSRLDVEQFMARMEGAAPLSQLTDGIHLHTLSCPDQASYEHLKARLRQLGFLAE